jgi:hypothetical protein
VGLGQVGEGRRNIDAHPVSLPRGAPRGWSEGRGTCVGRVGPVVGRRYRLRGKRNR